MPGTPRPVGWHQGLPPFWNAILAAIELTQQQTASLTAGATQGNLVDGNGNTIEVAGTNLLQTVVIGAQVLQTATPQAGVQVQTGLTGAGRAKQVNLATGTITTTKGSTAATLVSTLSGTFSGAGTNPLIGAANVTDPTSSIATPAITPGTTYTIAGAAITLSQNAAESGTGLYCAACDFAQATPVAASTWIAPTLLNSWANLLGTVGAGYLKDPLGFVHLRGRIKGGVTSSVAFALPPGYRPSSTGSDDYAAAGYDGVTGSVPIFVNVASNGNVSIWFSAGAGLNDVGLGGITFLAEN